MDSWDRLVQCCRGTFSETDMVSLYWDTLRGLCDHYHISSAVDIAIIELRWKAFGKGMNTVGREKSPPPGVLIVPPPPRHDSTVPIEFTQGITRASCDRPAGEIKEPNFG